MSEPKEFFYQIDDCVFPCSRSSIKNAALWADTVNEVKMAYQLHLDKSSYHDKLTKEEKEWAMREVKIYKRSWAEYRDQGSAKKDWSQEGGGGESGTSSGGAPIGLRPEDGAAAALRMPEVQPDGLDRCTSLVVAALAKRKEVAAIEAAERKRKREEDQAHLQALADEAAEKKRKREDDAAEKKRKSEEVITVRKRDLDFVLEVSLRAIEASRKCCDFLQKGLLAFQSQEAILIDAKGAVQRMLKK